MMDVDGSGQGAKAAGLINSVGIINVVATSQAEIRIKDSNSVYSFSLYEGAEKDEPGNFLDKAFVFFIYSFGFSEEIRFTVVSIMWNNVEAGCFVGSWTDKTDIRKRFGSFDKMSKPVWSKKYIIIRDDDII